MSQVLRYYRTPGVLPSTAGELLKKARAACSEAGITSIATERCFNIEVDKERYEIALDGEAPTRCNQQPRRRCTSSAGQWHISEKAIRCTLRDECATLLIRLFSEDLMSGVLQHVCSVRYCGSIQEGSLRECG